MIRAVSVLIAAAVSLHAQTLNTIYDFDSRTQPYGTLVQADTGDLYGTTPSVGEIFKVAPSGTLTTIYKFCSLVNCEDGETPNGGLIQGTDGNFYGTTQQGGTSKNGTVFKITPDGVLTTLHSFCSNGSCPDGQDPYAPLIQATDGELYGTTSYGGSYGGGTVFKITRSGTLTVLYSFCSLTDCADGERPFAGLVQAPSGDFYGTTYLGGANNGGTVFKITPSGVLTTIYNFCSQVGCADGMQPSSALVQRLDGDFYGTTATGGVNGTVFKITSQGTLTTLYTFCSANGCADGFNPSGLVMGTNGNFYGTTADGGLYVKHYCLTEGCGTIFEITPSGALTTLHSFCSEAGCADGAFPNGLVQDTSGYFYGTTHLYGADGGGTVFSLSVGLREFVEPRPASAQAGAVVSTLGTNLTGASSVKFGGISAVFNVVSSSLIFATVPANAGHGTISVTTPNGTPYSNVPFRQLR